MQSRYFLSQMYMLVMKPGFLFISGIFVFLLFKSKRLAVGRCSNRKRGEYCSSNLVLYISAFNTFDLLNYLIITKYGSPPLLSLLLIFLSVSRFLLLDNFLRVRFVIVLLPPSFVLCLFHPHTSSLIYACV